MTSRAGRLVQLLGVCVSAALFLALTSLHFGHGFFDDSFISLRYVKNLVDGHAGDPRPDAGGIVVVLPVTGPAQTVLGRARRARIACDARASVFCDIDRAAVWGAAVFALGLGALLAWKLWYFGSIIPLPAHMKLNILTVLPVMSVDYRFWIPIYPPLVVAAVYVVAHCLSGAAHDRTGAVDRDVARLTIAPRTRKAPSSRGVILAGAPGSASHSSAR